MNIHGAPCGLRDAEGRKVGRLSCIVGLPSPASPPDPSPPSEGCGGANSQPFAGIFLLLFFFDFISFFTPPPLSFVRGRKNREKKKKRRKGGDEAIDYIKGYPFENTIFLRAAANCFLNNLRVFCIRSVGKAQSRAAPWLWLNAPAAEMR